MARNIINKAGDVNIDLFISFLPSDRFLLFFNRMTNIFWHYYSIFNCFNGVKLMSREVDLSNLSALVVEDNNYMSTIIRAMLKGFGMQNVRDVSDSIYAFEELKVSEYDLVIVDYSLETLNGVEFTKMLRSANDSPNRFVPIIMLSAHTEKKLVEEARDAGITEFLRKPISARDLYLRVCEVILKPRPFIRSATYFGPDRRRHIDVNYTGNERRKGSLIEQLDENGDENAPQQTDQQAEEQAEAS